jgi:acetolactate synthase regulatory subunit
LFPISTTLPWVENNVRIRILFSHLTIASDRSYLQMLSNKLADVLSIHIAILNQIREYAIARRLGKVFSFRHELIVLTCWHCSGFEPKSLVWFPNRITPHEILVLHKRLINDLKKLWDLQSIEGSARECKRYSDPEQSDKWSGRKKENYFSMSIDAKCICGLPAFFQFRTTGSSACNIWDWPLRLDPIEDGCLLVSNESTASASLSLKFTLLIP